MSTVPRSLVWATHIDVLGVDRVVERRDDHLVIRSPSNPAFYWGNLLLFDEPPQPGDVERWERLFAEVFSDEPRVRHVTLAWDGPPGRPPAAPACEPGRRGARPRTRRGRGALDAGGRTAGGGPRRPGRRSVAPGVLRGSAGGAPSAFSRGAGRVVRRARGR